DEEIEEIFRQIDKNKNGKIDKRELQAFFKKHDRKFTAKQVTDYIKKWDGDNDGQLTLEDLKKGLCDS
ncbi:calmodulin-4, partial [Clonorchis sinensis]